MSLAKRFVFSSILSLGLAAGGISLLPQPAAAQDVGDQARKCEVYCEVTQDGWKCGFKCTFDF
jgi:hypothetical protein